MRLPYEILGIIFKWLEISDIVEISMICKELHNVVWKLKLDSLNIPDDLKALAPKEICKTLYLLRNIKSNFKNDPEYQSLLEEKFELERKIFKIKGQLQKLENTRNKCEDQLDNIRFQYKSKDIANFKNSIKFRSTLSEDNKYLGFRKIIINLPDNTVKSIETMAKKFGITLKEGDLLIFKVQGKYEFMSYIFELQGKLHNCLSYTKMLTSVTIPDQLNEFRTLNGLSMEDIIEIYDIKKSDLS